MKGRNLKEETENANNIIKCVKMLEAANDVLVITYSTGRYSVVVKTEVRADGKLIGAMLGNVDEDLLDSLMEENGYKREKTFDYTLRYQLG